MTSLILTHLSEQQNLPPALSVGSLWEACQWIWALTFHRLIIPMQSVLYVWKKSAIKFENDLAAVSIWCSHLCECILQIQDSSSRFVSYQKFSIFSNLNGDFSIEDISYGCSWVQSAFVEPFSGLYLHARQSEMIYWLAVSFIILDILASALRSVGGQRFVSELLSLHLNLQRDHFLWVIPLSLMSFSLSYRVTV